MRPPRHWCVRCWSLAAPDGGAVASRVDYTEDCPMFSGRITDVGIVADAGHGLIIEAPKTAGSLAVGGSVNVAGACLSAVEVGDSRFRVEVSPETANRSTLASLQPGGRVNLESPLRVGDRLDGNLVQGHVDAVGKVTLAEEETGGARRVWIRPPRRFLDDIVAKPAPAPACPLTSEPLPSAVSPTPMRDRRTSFSPAMSSRSPAGPAAWTSGAVTPRPHWPCARLRACPRWRPSAR